MAKATVTITDVGKNLTFSTETNFSGNYTYSRLLPGKYRVKIEAQGFKASVQDVIVNVDTATPADFRLEAGAPTDEVTITSEAPLLKTDRVDVATTFESRHASRAMDLIAGGWQLNIGLKGNLAKIEGRPRKGFPSFCVRNAHKVLPTLFEMIMHNARR